MGLTMANNYTLLAIELPTTESWDEEYDWLLKTTQQFEDYEKPFGHEGGGGWEVTRYENMRGRIFIHSDDSCDLESLAIMLREYLAKFHPDTILQVEYAFTCSKPRPGEFGGGAFVVSCEDYEFHNAGAWAAELAAEWRGFLTGHPDELAGDDLLSLDDDEEVE